jgi:large subunit ribosomal protein L14e
MSLYNVGRVCLKIAGRDAGRKCVVVEQVDNNFVMIDGDVRRKKVNIKHLEPLSQEIDLKDKASHDDVKKAFTDLGFSVWDKKSKKPAERPTKQRKVKEKKTEEKPKAEVKEVPKKEPAKESKEEVTPKATEEKSVEDTLTEEPKN